MEDANQGEINTTMISLETTNQEIILSSELGVVINAPIKGFKPDKKFVEIFEKIKLPELSNFIDEFDDNSIKYKILYDYFFDLELTQKKFNIINKKTKVLNGNDGLNDIKNLMRKLNKFQTKNISNVSYKIKILLKEEIIGLKENQKKYDYLYIFLIRCNHEIYSYIFLLENSNSSLEEIIKFLQVSSITAYKFGQIKKRVLSRELKIKIDYEDYSFDKIPFETLKEFEDLKTKINLENYLSKKEDIYYSSEDDLNTLLENLEDISYNSNGNFDSFIKTEDNINFLVIRNIELLYLFPLKKN
jgi:hypothetical protein